MKPINGILLQVPFHKQTSQFTCGPASVMMAMKYFQPKLNLSKGLELDIWRESNLVESYGTSKEGLAVACARRGFSVYTMGIPRKHSFIDEISNEIPSVDKAILELLYRDIRHKFQAMGLTNVNRRIKLQSLKALLIKSHIPLFLTTTALFGGREDLPHWVVLTGYSGDAVYVNNPLVKAPNTRVDEARLEVNLGYRGVQCAVVVRGFKRIIQK
jgi:predicted double-glycine peptidase